MAERIRWGILSTGWIAARFAEALVDLDDAVAYAVASRAGDRARAFAETHGIPTAYGSYEELVRDPYVDAVYVGTPHALHAETALLALRADKPVLCEKPFTMNAYEARRLIVEARTRGVFLMEAMWTRFLPAIAELREVLASGEIGEIRMMRADIGWRQPYDPQSRLYSPKLGGGALLDVGIYPLSLASWLFGPPTEIAATAQFAPTGVDDQCAVSMVHHGGELTTFVASLSCDTPREAVVIGTAGWVRIHGPLSHPEHLTLRHASGASTEFHLPHRGNGYVHQVIEAGRCLRQGLTESASMPLDETLAILETLDAIRERLGLRYPADEAALTAGGE